MIYIDGPDRVGKTTVARALLRQLPWHSYVHNTKPPMEVYGYYGRNVFVSRQDVILDRMHWSELAFRNAYHEPLGLTAHQWRLLELALMAQRCRVLYMTDSLDKIEERYSNGEMWPRSGLARVYAEYEALHERASAPYVSWLDSDRYTMPDLLEGSLPTETMDQIVYQEWKSLSESAHDLPLCHGIGHVGGEGFMLVGEAPSDADRPGRGHAPRLPWDFGPAAEWLWAALDAVNVKWYCGFYTNASAFISAENLRRYCDEVVRPRTVVALGSVAYKHCAAALEGQHEIELRHVDHPQHARRFRHAKFDDYALELAVCLPLWRESGDLTITPEIEAVTRRAGHKEAS